VDEIALQLGAPVRCADGAGGEVADVVIEPGSRRLTHLVVQTEDGQALLVPVELVGPNAPGRREVVLTCTVEELRAHESIREFAYLRFDEFPDADETSAVGIEDTIVLPSYNTGELGGYPGDIDPEVGITYDRIPRGEVELRRSSPVLCAEGEEVGHIDGFLVREGRVTHVVLEHGHLWGTRAVTIPVDAVEKIETDGVTLRLSKAEIGELPTVRSLRLPFS
jgi:sporulation protein YlmC with PRC-barrel domain